MTDCKLFGVSGIRLGFAHLGKATAVDATEHVIYKRCSVSVRWFCMAMWVYTHTETVAKYLDKTAMDRCRIGRTCETKRRSKAMLQVSESIWGEHCRRKEHDERCRPSWCFIQLSYGCWAGDVLDGCWRHDGSFFVPEATRRTPGARTIATVMLLGRERHGTHAGSESYGLRKARRLIYSMCCND